MQTESLHALEDFIGALGPAERFGDLVVVRGVREERRDQFGDAAVDTATQLPLGEQREPRLDLVQPGTRGGREVQMISRMLGEPALDRRRRVCAGVVEHPMDGEFRRDLGIDRIQKVPEFACAMPLGIVTK